ncbi:MAG TPA: GNAT family N-acetyltransferase [Thermoleophilia bacterium]|nr:GNAT family N-acetyltransferase [Thermoleophilia bacterium]
MIRALPEVFRTARLLAQRVAERHLADLERLHADPAVAEWIGDPATSDGLSEWVTAVVAPHWHMYGYGLFALYEKHARSSDDAVVGGAVTEAAEAGGAVPEAAEAGGAVPEAANAGGAGGAAGEAGAARLFVGRAGLVDAGDDVTAAFAEKRVVELEFAVAPGARGCGYATEIARALTGLALTSLDRESVAALVRPGNAGALRVLEKLDFAAAGELDRDGTPLLLLRRRR